MYVLDFYGNTMCMSSEVNEGLLCSRPSAQRGGNTALTSSTSLWGHWCSVACRAVSVCGMSEVCMIKE